MKKQAPINIIHSPETEPVTRGQDAQFQLVLPQIQAILQEAGFEQFLLTVYHTPDQKDDLGLYSGALGGSAVELADVGGLLLHANRISQQYVRFLAQNPNGG